MTTAHNTTPDERRLALSQRFLLEAQGHQAEASLNEEPAADPLRVYTHLMAMALERGSESGPFQRMAAEIQELTTPDAWSALRVRQPHAAQAVLALNGAIGNFQTALAGPAPGIYG